MLQSLLGRGSFGKAYRAEDEETGLRVAVKLPLSEEDLTVETANEERLSLYTRLLRETLQQTKKLPADLAPGQLTLIEGSGNPPCILEEFYEDSLLERLHAGLNFSDLCNSLAQVCDALASLHDQNIIHGNLKPGNIFYVHTESGTEVRLTDPVTPLWLENMKTLEQRQVGLSSWLPPEARDRGANTRLTTAVDTYHLARLFYEAVVEPDALKTNYSGRTAPYMGPLDKQAINRFKGALAQRLLDDNSNPHVRDLLIRKAAAFLTRALSVEAEPSPPRRFYSAAEAAARLVEIQELFHPGFEQLGMILLDPTKANGVYDEQEEIRFSLAFRCHGGIDDADLIICMTYVRDLEADQKVKDSGLVVLPSHDGNRFRFSFKIPGLAPGKYLVRVALAIKGSPGKPTPRDITIEVKAKPNARRPVARTIEETPASSREPRIPAAPAAPPRNAQARPAGARDELPSTLRPVAERPADKAPETVYDELRSRESHETSEEARLQGPRLRAGALKVGDSRDMDGGGSDKATAERTAAEKSTQYRLSSRAEETREDLRSDTFIRDGRGTESRDARVELRGEGRPEGRGEARVETRSERTVERRESRPVDPSAMMDDPPAKIRVNANSDSDSRVRSFRVVGEDKPARREETVNAEAPTAPRAERKSGDSRDMDDWNPAELLREDGRKEDGRKDEGRKDARGRSIHSDDTTEMRSEGRDKREGRGEARTENRLDIRSESRSEGRERRSDETRDDARSKSRSEPLSLSRDNRDNREKGKSESDTTTELKNRARSGLETLERWISGPSRKSHSLNEETEELEARRDGRKDRLESRRDDSRRDDSRRDEGRRDEGRKDESRREESRREDSRKDESRREELRKVDDARRSDEARKSDDARKDKEGRSESSRPGEKFIPELYYREKEKDKDEERRLEKERKREEARLRKREEEELDQDEEFDRSMLKPHHEVVLIGVLLLILLSILGVLGLLLL